MTNFATLLEEQQAVPLNHIPNPSHDKQSLIESIYFYSLENINFNISIIDIESWHKLLMQ